MPYALVVKRIVLLYGVCGGLLIAGLKAAEYRFVVIEHSIEIYGGVIAFLFAAVGIWLGLTLTRAKEASVASDVPTTASQPLAADHARALELGLTRREIDILREIAAGKSTREIADALFVSENTVKTHASPVFSKLNVRRRTQAVHVAKQLGLIQ